MTSKEFIATVEKVLTGESGQSWKRYNGYASAFFGGNRGSVWEALHNGHVRGVNDCLNVIDDLANGREYGPGNGSTFTARQQAAKEIIAELAAAGITRGQNVWYAGKGRVFEPNTWNY